MSASLARLLEVPEARRRKLERIVRRALEARRVVLTTHVNSDGDGIGSEAAIAAWLESRRVDVTIINPSPVPSSLRFLLHRKDLAVSPDDPAAAEAIRAADLILVLDTSEPKRVAPLDQLFDPAKTFVVDHHPPGASVVGQGGVQDATASATGELVYDMITLSGSDWPPESALAAYVAIVSDTGSFRFANTTPRAHAIAAELLAKGINPEDVFQRLYAIAPLRRLELLREALARLEYDSELGIAWMVLPQEVTEKLGSTSEDFDGLIDHARSLQGTRVAILFREIAADQTKVSLRSSGDADVNRIAREFGGGGHVKAAGATLPLPADHAAEQVLNVVRQELSRHQGPPGVTKPAS